jgi:hypothetical protein
MTRYTAKAIGLAMFMAILILAWLGSVVGTIYVAVHFIRKWW